MSEWIPDEEWRSIVQHVPIVSVDLLVKVGNGVLLGKRRNKPAKGYWFIPGGRVQKCETRGEAVHRIAKEELSTDVEIIESLGAFEHIYDTSDIGGVDTKHYLANGYVVVPQSTSFEPDGQHEAFRIFQNPPKPFHENVRQYFDAASSLPDW